MTIRPPPNFPRPPRWVLFDCYGTLIRWNEGLEETFAALLRERGAAVLPAAFRDAFKTRTHALIQQAYRPYREILKESLRTTLSEHGLAFREEDGRRLLEAIPRFPAHPEVRDALRLIRGTARLAMISNSEDHLILGSLGQIGIPFDLVITAERARAYKPSEAIFRLAMAEMGVGAADFVHVAAGWWTDIAPATRLGLHKVWINRRGEQGDAACEPYAELPDLAGLPALLGIAGPPRAEG